MNKIFFTFLAMIGLSMAMTAQINTPAASPGSKIEQKVGLSTITVDYSRPGAKGRTVFGDDALVSYGKMWRAGANSATKVSFSDNTNVGSQILDKGDYAILIKPTATSWEVMFYKYESTNWTSYTDKTPDATVTAKVAKSGRNIETFTIGFGEVTSNTANLNFEWENTIASLPISVEVDKVVMGAIDKVMAGPSSGDYYNAASYYFDSGKDLNKALEWIQKANAGDSPKFWQVRKEALILAELGKYKDAIAAATKSKELAASAGNDEYVKMNEQSIKDWTMK